MTHEAKNDPLFEAVKKMVIGTRTPWISLTQHAFQIGYDRAASLLEALEGDLVTAMDERGMRRMLTDNPVNTCDKVPYGSLWTGSSLLFDNFAVGKSNQLAVSVAQQVVELANDLCNPLFVYGGTGVGKTHLIQGIANKILTDRPYAKICYLRSECFVSDVVHAYQTNSFQEFRQFYYSLDVLLLDDVQLIEGKCKTQEELLYVFNALLASQKQIILTGDVNQNELPGIESRLISRFCGGLTVFIEPPDIENRASIVQFKSEQYVETVPNDVAYFIAEHMTSNVRQLEGFLNSLIAYARFHNSPISIELAKQALRGCP